MTVSFAFPIPWRRRRDFTEYLNPKSLEILNACRLEPSLADGGAGKPVPVRETRLFLSWIRSILRGDSLVFNRTVTLRDAWARIAEKGDRASILALSPLPPPPVKIPPAQGR